MRNEKLKTYLLHILLLFIMVLPSCNHKKEEVHNVIIERYSMNKFQSSDTSSLIIREKENRLEHYFGLEIIDGQESFFSQSFQIDTNNISKIFSWQTQLPLVDEKNYLVNNKKKIVRKYYYDDEKSIDEEAYYFIMDNRLVSYNSAAWNIQYFYEYEDSTIIGLLKNDTTSFFCRNCDVDMSKLLK